MKRIFRIITALYVLNLIIDLAIIIGALLIDPLWNVEESDLKTYIVYSVFSPVPVYLVLGIISYWSILRDVMQEVIHGIFRKDEE